ncbi:DNA cytosine methyltransferase [Spongiibacter sp. UBA1325]|jgi:DNA (cytosine-5)-methyltransferase 1|uniref:DNA cytosine methyltransferase n=1 Tax=Spongiibacter sp. UBA1325 TaxID=1947543 RepID=UPI00257E739E|nr:DNA (cytosine-5-)-methyltransferase [Spongiibacter sp. UBA1325]|tara:strand:+ start:971 stop:2554 length:1584 start_codon:yes stop_codon:yes gene_type:complete
MANKINVIDLFAGPGGLGEGFSAFTPSGSKSNAFNIRMSVEKEANAHKTLTLRALFRSIRHKPRKVEHYFDYVSQNIGKDELQSTLKTEWAEACSETLGAPKALGEDNQEIHSRLKELKKAHHGEKWVVIGGPPCQAYSLAGRSRNKGIKDYKPESDHRHFLYQEYLEVLSIIEPDVFVMENVKGILTSRVGGQRIFPAIRDDLRNPRKAAADKQQAAGREYRIYSFVCPPGDSGLFGNEYEDETDFVIKAEQFGIPQARHRVILLGVATDIHTEPSFLEKPLTKAPSTDHVLSSLPRLRSRLSKEKDSDTLWLDCLKVQSNRIKSEIKGVKYKHLRSELDRAIESMPSHAKTSSTTYPKRTINKRIHTDLSDWILADRPPSLLNHETRGHMATDLGRYLFASCWANAFQGSENEIPKAKDFPECLAPNHANWRSGDFADRFRVQAKGRPATTITSHISKDGHYYIHYDPTQCRSLTVREAARIQTFPDNYFFEGGRTAQYVQVGNAVPPFLAHQLAEIVYQLVKNL